MRKTGRTGNLYFIPQLLELKQFEAFFGGEGVFQRACSLTIATCQSHAPLQTENSVPITEFTELFGAYRCVKLLEESLRDDEPQE